jgi:salicylate biosynthesis isochorismate synthase
MADLEGFGKLCRDAAKAAADRGRPVLASWSATVPGFTVADRVRQLSVGSERTFVWASSWSGQRRLALGTALDLSGHGADRFEQVSAFWKLCRDVALVDGTGRQPSLVGGFSFRHHDNDEQRTRVAMPDALMWLPTAELIEEPGGPTVLTLNAWLRPDADAFAAIRYAEHAARSLLADPPVAASEQARVVSIRETPSALEWKLLVRRVLDAIAAGSFDKLVLARQLAMDFDRPVAVARVLASLLDNQRVGAVFGAQLAGRWFVGRTPECLLHLRGQRVDTHGLAGSVPRDPDPVRDAQLSRHLQTDPKLEREHAIVADVVRHTLQRFFRDVRTDATDSVLRIADLQHRQTRISAVHPRSDPDLLRLAGVLHPTPAVGGFPAAPALRFLTASEPFDRGWYAAPIGWIGADGDGELAVAIRSAMISGASAVVYAGCGIVEGSDPDEEYDETRVKMRQMLTALGVSNDLLVTQ